MQPYFFPYLGYFQLIRAVDSFVFYDDVNYIKGGWINRNYILGNGNRQLITMPVIGVRQNRLINNISVGRKHKILKSVQHNYKKAPHFEAVYPIIEDIFKQPETNLARFLDYQLRSVCGYLGLNPNWHTSSGLDKDNDLRGQDKIIQICEKLEATHYINAPGGKHLYDREAFAARDLKLSFIQQKDVSYRQFGREFVPNLSIIDIMMFNDREHCAKLLEKYELG